MSNQNDRKTAGIMTVETDAFRATKAELISYLVDRELAWALNKFAAFNSAHEGYAVIKEEVDELWDCIKSNKHTTPLDRAEEALQIAAMAMRFVFDSLSDEGVKLLAARQREKGR